MSAVSKATSAFLRMPPSANVAERSRTIVFLGSPWTSSWIWRWRLQPYFAKQGFPSLSVSMGFGNTQTSSSGIKNMDGLVKEFRSIISPEVSSYPPLIVAHGFGALVAQKYIESFPAAGLALIAPMEPTGLSEMLQHDFGVDCKEEISNKKNDKESNRRIDVDLRSLCSNTDWVRHRLLGMQNAKVIKESTLAGDHSYLYSERLALNQLLEQLKRSASVSNFFSNVNQDPNTISILRSGSVTTEASIDAVSIARDAIADWPQFEANTGLPILVVGSHDDMLVSIENVLSCADRYGLNNQDTLDELVMLPGPHLSIAHPRYWRAVGETVLDFFDRRTM